MLYVACWLTPGQAQRLNVGGEPLEAMHLTLSCIGDPAELVPDARERAQAVLARLTAIHGPIQAQISGVGVFMGGDKDVLYASVDAPALPAIRQQLVDGLELAGLPCDDTHGFNPHITLAYLDPGSGGVEEIDSTVFPIPITFDSVCLCEPGRPHNPENDVRFSGPVSKEDPGGGQVHIDSVEGLGGDADGEKKKRRKVEMLKADDERRIVYGVVLEPNVEDTQGDVCSAADIEKAAHGFLYGGKPIGIQHGLMAPETVRPVESFIAPADFEMGGQMVRKGSWVLAAHVPEQKLWDAVKSAGFTGWSVAGTGVRTPI